MKEKLLAVKKSKAIKRDKPFNELVEETIELVVKVKINYPDKSSRSEAIKRAKQIVLSTSILGNVGAIPKSAKLVKTR